MFWNVLEYNTLGSVAGLTSPLDPNIVMNSAVQVCWEKATRYLEIDERLVYCTEERYVIDPKQAVDLV